MSANVDEFKREWGHLCVLAARALTQGHASEQVADAARGKGTMVLPVYVAMRAQRRKVEQHLRRLNMEGVTADELAPDLYQTRMAVQGEWTVKLPMFAEVKP